ncbi:MAG: glycoside hydrolase N-terminal domain-containing protein, partial [Bifidobacterium longum]|nr:glycoside hydrolase N-terminal domain-containing protein [Bifidobacterium longum]
TVDATGLQTFPEVYKNGVPLGTQSQWGWHSFGNPENYKPEEALVEYDFGHGHKELYATQPKEPGRAKEASDWYRVNPHRLHLGIIGLELENEVRPSDVQNIQQSLDMWNGIINSRFTLKETPYHIQTVCHPERDMIAARLSARQPAGIKFHFPYPTGGHCDDACNWEANDKHSTTLHANGQCIYIHLPIHTASVRCSHPDFCGSTTSLFRTLAKLLDTGSCRRLLTMYGCPCQRIGTPGRIKPISARHPMCRINPATGNRTDLQLLVREIPFGNDLVASGTIRLMGTSRITGPHFILV